MIKATGQNVLDALEWASADLGKYDENHQEVECATLLHAAGLKYVVDTSIENTCVADARGMWSGAPTGEYRVKNVEIYNRETACYEPLDLEKEYFVAGSNYLLCSNGGGLTMFEKAEKINNNMGEDDWVLAEYIKNFKCGDEEIPVISTQNSPLFSYRNYLIDYENVNGSGRLKRTDDILTENPVDEPMDNVQF